ncbi:hypothetical protein ADM98_15735 [Exiguobacterium sp. BMC-KP]|uniref:glycerate kinase n=1 Tax=Exiguobacterium sp. BMC-KP TaxID=1684312 RepID=UPI0006AA2ED1|nr:glycerate kinase [Exiguobacterium sp. BMC-KP]KOP30282.1 hypothetical protein ADM98_15735 [Exiguobacterium sp. BMC-KP]
MRHLILLDTFKGSITSEKAAEAVAAGILQQDPFAIIDRSPVADGGEGTLAVFASEGYTIRRETTIDLAGRSCKVMYAQKGDEAIIEVAQICGLTMRHENDDPFLMHTRGVGNLVNTLRKKGITKIRIALGGTGTTDGGLGFLHEMGCSLKDEKGVQIQFQTNPLVETKQIIRKKVSFSLEALVDVRSPYSGEDGPAYLFGAQKGLQRGEIVCLDQRLKEIGSLLELEHVQGAGAAGGLGGAIHAIGGTITSGAQSILAYLRVEERLKQADYVWTGEGKVDRQSQLGKVTGEIARVASIVQVPCLVLAGVVEEKIPGTLDCRSIHEGQPITLDREQTYARLKEQARSWLEELSAKQG